GELGDQVPEADLDLGALEGRQYQAQVGQAAPVEGSALAGEDLALGRVEFVELAHQADVVGGGDEGVAEQGAQVLGHVVGPAQHLVEGAGAGSGGGDEVAREYAPHRLLVAAQVGGVDVACGAAAACHHEPFPVRISSRRP